MDALDAVRRERDLLTPLPTTRTDGVPAPNGHPWDCECRECYLRDNR